MNDKRAPDEEHHLKLHKSLSVIPPSVVFSGFGGLHLHEHMMSARFLGGKWGKFW